MIYYSISTLTEAYSLSEESIKYRIKRGQLIAIKVPMCLDNPLHAKFVVPHSELPKLQRFKLHDPVCHFDDQPEFWNEYILRQKERIEARNAESEKRHSQFERHLSYRDYLRSETWQNKRQQRLAMDGFKCQMCGTGKNLHVHHITYKHYMNELMQDLITVCDKCHRKIHENDITLEERIDEARGIDTLAEDNEIQSLKNKAEQAYDVVYAMREAAHKRRSSIAGEVFRPREDTSADMAETAPQKHTSRLNLELLDELCRPREA